MSGADKDTLRTELLAIFREEANDHLRAIAAESAVLETLSDPAAARPSLDRLFRVIHTLKGAARSLSVTGVEQTCHDAEDLCADLVHGRVTFDADIQAELVDLIDAVTDATRRALAPPGAAPGAAPAWSVPLERPAPALPAASLPAPPAPAPPAATPAPVRVPARPEAAPPSFAPAPTERPAAAAPVASASAPASATAPAPDTHASPVFVRLESSRIQRLGLMAEDLLAPRLASQARTEEARLLHARLTAARRDLGTRGRRGREDSPVARSPAEALRGAEEAARALASALAEDNRALRSLIDTLMIELRRARMMPAGDMLAAFPEMIVDLGRTLGKRIQFQTGGTELLIDRQVADLLKDPLIHAIRNAIDHGIELPDARIATGKPAEGTIALTIGPADGGRVAIEIRDDGCGIDLSAVRTAAVRNRLLSDDDARALADTDILDLVFQPNLSTRSVISITSGRGLGLAIVRERVERLGGRIQLDSRPGAGTRLRLEVPGALANFRGIGVRVGGADYVWPHEAVERTLALSAGAAAAARARGAIQLEDTLLPFDDLSRILGAPSDAPPTASGIVGALVIRAGARRGVVAVADITGECEAIVKELRPPLLRVRHVLAAGLLGSGRLALILRPADILDAQVARPDRAAPAREPTSKAGRSRILVVDDSLTTRAMEVGLLEAAGYEVMAAADGLDAWSLLQRERFDAIISDVDMPNLDGFGLTERVRADPRLSGIPIVLVTAMEQREDHDRGLRLGANAYMMKSAFDQTLLIDLVRRML